MAKGQPVAYERECRECNWPGCKRRAAPWLWACHKHWARLPETYRKWLTVTFRVSGPSSSEYRQLNEQVQAWARRDDAQVQTLFDTLDKEAPGWDKGVTV